MKGCKVYILILLFFCTGLCLHAQALNDSVFTKPLLTGFSLLNTTTQKSSLAGTLSPGQSMLLFVFLSPDCPVCKNYTPVLNALQQQYGQQVKMIGIIPGRTYSAATINAFARKYKISYPLFIDAKKGLTNYLHAAITPEIILLNNRYELLYKGAIDNRVKQLGVQNASASANYLADAISSYLQHNSIAVKRTKATGCRINDF